MRQNLVTSPMEYALMLEDVPKRKKGDRQYVILWRIADDPRSTLTRLATVDTQSHTQAQALIERLKIADEKPTPTVPTQLTNELMEGMQKLNRRLGWALNMLGTSGPEDGWDEVDRG